MIVWIPAELQAPRESVGAWCALLGAFFRGRSASQTSICNQRLLMKQNRFPTHCHAVSKSRGDRADSVLDVHSTKLLRNYLMMELVNSVLSYTLNALGESLW